MTNIFSDIRRRLAAMLVLYVVVPLILTAQTETPAGSDTTIAGPVIGSIAFIGNDITVPQVILREMTLRKGDVITSEALAESRARIYNMGLFNSVHISYPPMDTTVLLVEVTERWYLWPVPLAGIVDRDWSHWYYGAGIQHWNVRGRNEKIFAGGVFGYNPWASVAYSNPWILDEANIFLSTELKFQRYENKNLLARGSMPDFDENHFYFNQAIGHRIDTYRKVWTQFGFQYVHVTDPAVGLTASSNGIDRNLYFGIAASHDSRDYLDYPMSGVNSGIAIQKKGLGTSDVDYVSATADVRYYQPLFSGTSLGIRAFTRVVSGPVVPEYDNVFFGFSERIRGRFKERFEGQNIVGASIEYRVPVFAPRQVHFGFVPVKQFRDWRFGMYAAAFVDGGTVWNKHDRVDVENAPSGYGAGLHFLLPYGFVLRLEYAFSNMGDGQFIYDLKAAF